MGKKREEMSTVKEIMSEMVKSNTRQPLFVPFGEEHESLGIAHWRPQEPFTVRILADALQNRADGRSEFLFPRCALFGSGF